MRQTKRYHHRLCSRDDVGFDQRGCVAPTPASIPRRAAAVAVATVAMLLALVVPGSALASTFDPGEKQLRGDLAQASASLRGIAAKANAALDASQQANQQQDRADESSTSAQAKLTAASRLVDVRARVIANYVADSYRRGGSPESLQFVILLGSNSANVIREADVLRQLGVRHGETLQQAVIARRQQELAAVLADVATSAADRAAAAATDARRTADLLVEKQRAIVSEIETQRQAQGSARPPIVPPPSDPATMKAAQ